ncbi:CBS domain-containing protein [Cognatishimia activa]|nr:CBS domain-containing protein [Cognatishimia activa]MEE2943564.1 CBS domain-containing protein [Pseudomonadota bacterium]
MVSPDRQITVKPDTSVRDAFQLFKQHRARFLPVVDDNGIYHGVFTAPTLLKLLLPKAATIGMNLESTRVPIGSLGFMSLTKEDFAEQLDALRDENVRDNMSSPVNIPVVAPTTPIMEGIFLYYKYKRHVVLVDPDTGRFVGTLSSNSLLEKALA